MLQKTSFKELEKSENFRFSHAIHFSSLKNLFCTILEIWKYCYPREKEKERDEIFQTTSVFLSYIFIPFHFQEWSLLSFITSSVIFYITYIFSWLSIWYMTAEGIYTIVRIEHLIQSPSVHFQVNSFHLIPFQSLPFI